MRGKLAAVTAAILTTAVVAGCSSPQKQASGSDSNLPAPLPSPSSTGSTAVTFVLPYHVSMDAKDDDGYSWTATLDRGTPRAAKDFIGMQFGGSVLGASCEVDPQTAVVEPFTITIVNKTPNTSFTADPGRIGARLGGEITTITNSKLRMFGEVTYGDGQSE